MATVVAIYWLPTGGLTAQADWVGPTVSGQLALFLHSTAEPGDIITAS